MFKYILVGNPNSGKTTLFNALTQSAEKTGNFHGVTATLAKSGYKFKNSSYIVEDLPGIYSLQPYSLEERVSVNALKGGDYHCIICLIDALSPLGGLELVKNLKALNKSVVVGVTKLNLLRKRGGELNLQKLEKALGVQVLEVNAKSSRSVKDFKNKISNLKKQDLNDFNSEKILKQIYLAPKRRKLEIALLNPALCFAVCLVIFSVIFFISFSQYSFISKLSRGLENGVENLVQLLSDKMLGLGVSEFVIAVIQKGLSGCGAVLGFLPRLVTLNFFMLLLEESGIACRYSIILSNRLKRGGLSGKSVFPLISSLGCTALSCKLCNASENQKIKERTLNCLPFVPCSAKNVVYLFLCSKIFSYPAIALILIYIFNLIALTVYAYFAERVNPSNSSPEIVEIAPLTTPDLKSVISSSLAVALSFFKKIILSVLMVSVTLSILTSLDGSFNFTTQLQNSLLARASKKISFLFAPIGLDKWEIVVALICGLFAKETTVGAITMLCGSSFSLPITSGVSLITFFTLYSPCLIALSAFNKEKAFLGVKIFIKQTVFGYIGALFVYNLLTKNFVFSIIILSLIIVGWLGYENRYSKRKRKTISHCRKARRGVFFTAKTFTQKRRKGKRQEGK